jgi:hypothetical protein
VLALARREPSAMLLFAQLAGLAYVEMVVSRLVGLTVMRRRFDS